jgi:hypothetical protein
MSPTYFSVLSVGNLLSGLCASGWSCSLHPQHPSRNPRPHRGVLPASYPVHWVDVSECSAERHHCTRNVLTSLGRKCGPVITYVLIMFKVVFVLLPFGGVGHQGLPLSNIILLSVFPIVRVSLLLLWRNTWANPLKDREINFGSWYQRF